MVENYVANLKFHTELVLHYIPGHIDIPCHTCKENEAKQAPTTYTALR